MSSANRYLPNYSVDDYQAWDGDWELWNGIPISMSPSPFGPHQNVCTKLTVQLSLSIERVDCKAVVLSEIDWIVSENTVVRPDLTVICGGVPPKHVEQCPALVAEILSPSTEQRDRTEKFELYREQGVPYYLVVDPVEKNLTAFQLNSSEKYDSIKFTDELNLIICESFKLKIPIAKLFS